MKTDLGILSDWILKDLPINGEWRSDGDGTFYLYAANLLKRGWSVSDIKQMLSGLYCAVCQEYGE